MLLHNHDLTAIMMNPNVAALPPREERNRMTSFLSKAACNGRRPSHLASRHHYQRPDLIARLLRERHVARFLVAPGGFGKTGLAMEYADTVFSFEHVFWINGHSPCFLRDLDGGIIASTLTSLDDHPFLVVLEDIPPLGTVRAAALSGVLDSLLDRGCEVVATCLPSCDSYAALQRDRLKLAANDLLLSDGEVDAVRTGDERAAAAASAVPSAYRVPSLRWGPAGSEESFLVDGMREELPADVLLVAATMVVLGTGTLGDIASFCPCGADVIGLLAKGYPHLGIDVRCERFETPDFEAASIAKAVGGKLDALAVRSYFSDRDALAGRWADALVSRGDGERACALVGALCSRKARASWLAVRSHDLLKQACLLPCHELHASLGTSVTTAHLEVEEALRLVVLGDEAAALGYARRRAFDSDAPHGARALAALILARRAHGAIRTQAAEELARLAGLCEGAKPALALPDKPFAPDEIFWRPLVVSYVTMMSDPSWSAPARAAEDALRVQGASEDALMLAAAWALEKIVKERVAQPPTGVSACAAVVTRIEHYVGRRLSAMEEGSFDLFAAAAGLALERAREQGVLAENRVLDAAGVLMVHRVEMEVFDQRRTFERASQERIERCAERVATHPDAYLDGRYAPKHTRARNIVPLLTVNLFGGLDVRIGESPVSADRFRRQKVKTLLALLVLSRGREIPRDRLVRTLWPESELDTARKNFYSIWSLLRRALSSPSGACPYLVRQQNGCRLDERLLATDVSRFDAVCRMLLFGQPGAEGWARLYAEIDDLFADDLMPSEQDNDLIVQARDQYRVQLVDALVAAAERLVSADGAQEGLWFARAALRRDRTREDAYLALMRAQIAAGQRTAALETYFSCRRFLTSELGIDPSLKTIELYRSIIETEEPMN